MIDDDDFLFLDLEEGEDLVEEKISFQKPSWFNDASTLVQAMVTDVISEAKDIRNRLTSGENLSASERKINKSQLSKLHGKNSDYISSTNRTKHIKELNAFIVKMNEDLKLVSEVKFDKQSRSLQNMTRQELIEFGREAKAAAQKARQIIASQLVQDIYAQRYLDKRFSKTKNFRNIESERDKYAAEALDLRTKLAKRTREYMDVLQQNRDLQNQIETLKSMKVHNGGKDDG
jgi:hypothetical protein